MRGTVLGAALALLLTGVVDVAAQEQPVRVSLTGRVQLQWNGTSVDETQAGTVAPIASSTFETRRVRIGTRIAVEDWITGMIESDVALGRLQLKQVWAAFEVDSGLVVRAGQFKKPFGLIEQTSSTQIAPIERGVRIRGLEPALWSESGGALPRFRNAVLIGEHYALLDAFGYAGYDLGAAVEGEWGPWELSAGVFNGNGPDARDENDGKSLAARVRWSLPVEQSVTVGAAWSRRELLLPAATLPLESGSGNAFAVEAESGGFRRGLWLLAEAATGDNFVDEGSFASAYGAISYFRALGDGRVEGVEPVFRLSWGDPDRDLDGDAGVLATPGVNFYFSGRNRLMLNWDFYRPEGELSMQHAPRAQVNLYF